MLQVRLGDLLEEANKLTAIMAAVSEDGCCAPLNRHSAILPNRQSACPKKSGYGFGGFAIQRAQYHVGGE
jgi:hypothetical protein